MQTNLQAQPTTVQLQPNNASGFNFLGTTSTTKPDTNFLGIGSTSNSTNSSQIIKGY